MVERSGAERRRRSSSSTSTPGVRLAPAADRDLVVTGMQCVPRVRVAGVVGVGCAGGRRACTLPRRMWRKLEARFSRRLNRHAAHDTRTHAPPLLLLVQYARTCRRVHARPRSRRRAVAPSSSTADADRTRFPHTHRLSHAACLPVCVCVLRHTRTHVRGARRGAAHSVSLRWCLRRSRRRRAACTTSWRR